VRVIEPETKTERFGRFGIELKAAGIFTLIAGSVALRE